MAQQVILARGLYLYLDYTYSWLKVFLRILDGLLQLFRRRASMYNYFFRLNTLKQIICPKEILWGNAFFVLIVLTSYSWLKM